MSAPVPGARCAGAAFVIWRGKEHKCETAGLDIFLVSFDKTELVAVKIQRGLEIGDPDHGVKIAHDGVLCGNRVPFQIIGHGSTVRPVAARSGNARSECSVR